MEKKDECKYKKVDDVKKRFDNCILKITTIMQGKKCNICKYCEIGFTNDEKCSFCNCGVWI